MIDKKHSISDLLLFEESPFAFWCQTVNDLVKKGLIDESHKVPITEGNLYSEYFLKKAQNHEIELKDFYLIQKEMEIDDYSSNSSFKKTIKSINNKSQAIYQGSLEGKEFTARPDFLVLNENNRYDIVDAKLSRNIKKKYELQLYCYGYLLNELEGYFPERSLIYLVGGDFVEVQIQDFKDSFFELRENFYKFLSSFSITRPPHPTKNEFNNNLFADQITKTWIEKESIELIGGITYKQVQELNKCGIETLTEFSSNEINSTSISNNTYFKLFKKACALLKSKEEIYVEINNDNLDDLLSISDLQDGDLYIDFEWYPYSGELENFFYLFGYFQYIKNNSSFDYIWSDNEDEEENSFKNFVDFLLEHNSSYPESKIYHYNHSEKTELLKLCKKYEYKEAQINELIEKAFIDLLKPIRSSFTFGLSSNSLKEIEKVLDIGRQEEVQSGGQSMTYFEKFYFNGEWDLKDEIVLYNKQDCENLNTLHKWLLEQQAKVKY